MNQKFDNYTVTYGDTINDSIAFSGIKHDFFMQAKADLITRYLEKHDYLHPGTKLRALDIGCGIGTIHPRIRQLFLSIDGCDISHESIAQARQNNPAIRYSAYSGRRLPYPSHSFDFAMTVCVVHHVPPSEWPIFFAEMRRVLRPGGLACIIEHNPLNPATRLAVLRCPFDDDAVLLRSSMTHRLLSDAGFSDIMREYFLLFPSAGRTIRRIEYALAELPFGAQYACFARA